MNLIRGTNMALQFAVLPIAAFITFSVVRHATPHRRPNLGITAGHHASHCHLSMVPATDKVAFCDECCISHMLLPAAGVGAGQNAAGVERLLCPGAPPGAAAYDLLASHFCISTRRSASASTVDCCRLSAALALHRSIQRADVKLRCLWLRSSRSCTWPPSSRGAWRRRASSASRCGGWTHSWRCRSRRRRRTCQPAAALRRWAEGPATCSGTAISRFGRRHPPVKPGRTVWCHMAHALLRTPVDLLLIEVAEHICMSGQRH
jgi:hypothetical protein